MPRKRNRDSGLAWIDHMNSIPAIEQVLGLDGEEDTIYDMTGRFGQSVAEMLEEEQAEGQAACPVVFISHDKKEIHVVVSERLHAKNRARKQRSFTFVGLRIVQISNGEKLVGWCNNPDCSNAEDHVQQNFEYKHYPPQQTSTSSRLVLKCQWAQKVVRVWGGEHQLRSLLESGTPSVPSKQTGHLLKPLGSGSKIAVRSGWGFNDWAVIKSHTASAGWLCTSCSNKHSCSHIVTANPEATTQPQLDNKKIKPNSRKQDLTTDARRQTSTAKKPLPEDGKDAL